MKKYFIIIVLGMVLFPLVSFSQEKDTVGKQTAVKQNDTVAKQPAATLQDSLVPPAPKKETEKPFGLKSGFYLKFGPVFPVGNYASGQVLEDPDIGKTNPESVYFPAKIGAAMDMGFMIYIGPAFANNHMRVGIDATFLSFVFNSVKPEYHSISLDTLEGTKTKYWYYYGGQKFGPVISVRPIDRLVLDFSYKINAYIAYLHHMMYGKLVDEWGKNLAQSEISMNIRYSFMLISFQYNFGKTQYNDFDSNKPTHYVDNNTFRFLVGFKF